MEPERSGFKPAVTDIELVGERELDEAFEVEVRFNLDPIGYVGDDYILTRLSDRPTRNEGEELVTVTELNGDSYCCWMKPKGAET